MGGLKDSLNSHRMKAEFKQKSESLEVECDVLLEIMAKFVMIMNYPKEINHCLRNKMLPEAINDVTESTKQIISDQIQIITQVVFVRKFAK